MKLFSLAYTRPKRIETSSIRSESDFGSEQEKSDGSVKSGRSGYSAGIPDSLTFEKIINGGTCPVSPPSLRQLGAVKREARCWPDADP